MATEFKKKPVNGGSHKAPPKVHKAGRWFCPKCKNTIEIMVSMVVPPSCCNHIGGHVVSMEWLGKK